MRYVNYANGYSERVTFPGSFIGCFLFGSLYFMVKGVWSHAIISLVLAICTIGISWFIYPLFAYSIISKHYRQRGWVQCAGRVRHPRHSDRDRHPVRGGRPDVSPSYGRRHESSNAYRNLQAH